MTVAPRGMDNTKSDNSGRNARYATPPVDMTTTPSGRPIEIVVRYRALMSVKMLAHFESDCVQLALGVTQLNAVT